MQYKKIIVGDTIIEFFNNWLGEETVVVNGQMLSKKSSMMGTNHYFTVREETGTARYILTTKVNEQLQILVDLSRNGQLLERDIVIPFGSKPRNKAKKQGMMKLKEYDLEEALVEFQKALKEDPKDAEIFFHMACAYSVLEKTAEGFSCLKKAVEFGLKNHDIILQHDMLAYLRMHEVFEDFLNSGFTEYDETRIQKTDGDRPDPLYPVD